MQKKAADKPMQLEYHISSLSLEPGESGPATVKLDGFALSLVGDSRAQLKTDVTLRDGEKVVVGTSTVQDKGLVVVVSTRVIREAPSRERNGAGAEHQGKTGESGGRDLHGCRRVSGVCPASALACLVYRGRL